MGFLRERGFLRGNPRTLEPCRNGDARGTGVQIRAAHDSRPQSIVLYWIVDPGLDMSAGMIHRIGVRGCWRCRWPFGSQLFINSGLRAGLCLPFSVLPRTSSYTGPNPLLLLPLLSSLLLSHPVVSSPYIACEHCHCSSPESFHYHASSSPNLPLSRWFNRKQVPPSSIN